MGSVRLIISAFLSAMALVVLVRFVENKVCEDRVEEERGNLQAQR